ncbi:MAG: hypothetical protein IKC39_04905 [Clostridia bacterium]|nr:hypothetical protein [Clostridia bacterium]
MKSERKNKSVSSKSRFLIIFGFLFFINPVPANVDILPDVFGCALLFFGLTQLAYFDGSVDNARKTLIYLFVTEAVKLLLTKPMLATEIGSNRMLAATAFSIIEGIIYIIFFRQLFGGISYFAMRNNCNKTLKNCENISLLSYLAFFSRIAATLLPELISIIELRIYTETDFDVIDTITDIVSIKPILTIMLSMLAFGTAVIWFFNSIKFFNTFHSEASETLDTRYTVEYSEQPDSVRIKRLRMGKYAIYFSLFFLFDISFDGVRAIPASLTFLLLFASCFFFDKICEFKKTKILAIPAFLLMIASEWFRTEFNPNGAVVIYETALWKVIVGAVIAILTAFVSMLCIRFFLMEAQNLSASLGSERFSISICWISFCVFTVLWGIGLAVPYLYPFTVTARYVAVIVFIYKTAKIFSVIYEEEEARFILK